LRGIVHAAQIACVLRVPTPPIFRRGLKQEYARARLARHERSAERGIATTDDEYVKHGRVYTCGAETGFFEGYVMENSRFCRAPVAKF
jgi:hypothetical protein